MHQLRGASARNPSLRSGRVAPKHWRSHSQSIAALRTRRAIHCRMVGRAVASLHSLNRFPLFGHATHGSFVRATRGAVARCAGGVNPCSAPLRGRGVDTTTTSRRSPRRPARTKSQSWHPCHGGFARRAMCLSYRLSSSVVARHLLRQMPPAHSSFAVRQFGEKCMGRFTCLWPPKRKKEKGALASHNAPVLFRMLLDHSA